MLPTEVLQNILLWLTRRMLDRLTVICRSFANILLADAFATQSPLRSVRRIVLYSLENVVIVFRLSDVTVGWIRPCFFDKVSVNGSVPQLVQWICANRGVLNAGTLGVSTPLASLELFSVRCFKDVTFLNEEKAWRDHVGSRQSISLQCDLLRACEMLFVKYNYSCDREVPDFVFIVEDIVEWLHSAEDTMKDRRLELHSKHLDGDVVRLVELLEEHAVGSAVPFSYSITLDPLQRSAVERIQQMRRRRFLHTTGEYFEI